MIVLKNVSRAYGSGEARFYAVRDVSLEVAAAAS